MRIEALNSKWLLTLLLIAALIAGVGVFSLPEQAAAAEAATAPPPVAPAPAGNAVSRFFKKIFG